MKRAIIIFMGILLIVSVFLVCVNNTNKSVETLSKYGSRGEEVKTIQQKLKNWGYYKGSVDGIYGSQTQAAVKKFQKTNGLTQDRYCRTKNTSRNGYKFVK